MGAKFFSHRTPRGIPAGAVKSGSENALDGRDRQQALVLEALRHAAGAPVSYAELREVGVELPASVVSELELAGLTIERCVSDPGGAVGVRLDPINDLPAIAGPAVRHLCRRTGAQSGVEQDSDGPRLEPRGSVPEGQRWLSGLSGKGPGRA